MNFIYLYLHNVLGTLVCLFIVRLFIVYLRIHKKKKGILRSRTTAKLMVVLGSGGHTHEALHLMRNINERIRPRIYVIADTDVLSEKKANQFEETQNSSKNKGIYESSVYEIEKIPRSREVAQSWFTTIFTTIWACICSFRVVFRHMPDAIFCNGPGTCIPVCLSALLIHILGLKHITIIYVESFCRVKSLSLSGLILYWIADHFYVNWPELKEKYPHVEYVGQLF